MPAASVHCGRRRRRGDGSLVAHRRGTALEISRSPRRGPDFVPDGRRDAADLRCRAASLRGRLADSGAPGPAAQDRPVLGAGALHLHVRVDGEIRRRLRGAHRHPRRRRRADQPAARGDAQGVRAVRPARGRHLHSDRRHARCEIHVGHRADELDLARPRNSEMDRLPLHSSRLVPHVFSFPPGRLALRANG